MDKANLCALESVDHYEKETTLHWRLTNYHALPATAAANHVKRDVERAVFSLAYYPSKIVSPPN